MYLHDDPPTPFHIPLKKRKKKMCNLFLCNVLASKSIKKFYLKSVHFITVLAGQPPQIDLKKNKVIFAHTKYQV